jgi:AbrB family looped-hinge helix DNA binding protein
MIRKKRGHMHVKLSQKGGVVLPASMRKKHGLKPGAIFKVVDYGGVLALIPMVNDPVREGAGILKGGDSLTKLIIEEHHNELE